MKQEHRDLIARIDAATRGVGLPAYSDLVDTILRGQGLMPLTSPNRKHWFERVAALLDRIHKK